MLVRVLIAVVAGSVIGYERELHRQRVGIRTVSIVCVGACIYTLVSIYGFVGMGGSVDPSRIAAQVVVGVGFIGAGVMFREGASVHGLTTAATIWFAAAVGVLAGTGMYVLTGISTVLAFLILRYFPHPDGQ